MPIPDKHVEIEITIDEEGNLKQEIVGYGNGSSCSTADGEKILKDLFGDIGEDSDWGKTKAYYEENRVKVNPSPQTPATQKTQKEKKKMHLGFGV